MGILEGILGCSPIRLMYTSNSFSLMSIFLLGFDELCDISAADQTKNMTTNPKADEHSPGTENEQEAKPVAIGWVQKIEEKFRETKEHAETYPYVWGSYILVYGTLGAWVTYRWRCLRKAEDRVRALHEKVRKKYEEAPSSTEVQRPVKYGSSPPKPQSADKVDK